MASKYRFGDAFRSLRQASRTHFVDRTPPVGEESLEEQRARFNRRLSMIRGTEEAKRIKHYRNFLMRRTYNKAGDLPEVSSARPRGDKYYRLPDEFELLHRRLDEYGVAECRT